MESVCAVVCLGFPITGLSGVRVVSSLYLPWVSEVFLLQFPIPKKVLVVSYVTRTWAIDTWPLDDSNLCEKKTSVAQSNHTDVSFFFSIPECR